jgi:hypothetical protein
MILSLLVRRYRFHRLLTNAFYLEFSTSNTRQMHSGPPPLRDSIFYSRSFVGSSYIHSHYQACQQPKDQLTCLHITFHGK